MGDNRLNEKKKEKVAERATACTVVIPSTHLAPPKKPKYSGTVIHNATALWTLGAHPGAEQAERAAPNATTLSILPGPSAGVPGVRTRCQGRAQSGSAGRSSSLRNSPPGVWPPAGCLPLEAQPGHRQDEHNGEWKGNMRISYHDAHMKAEFRHHGKPCIGPWKQRK